MDTTPELVTWTREALERLFDLSFLGEHVRAPMVAGRFADSRMLQEAILEAIKQLSPPAQAAPQSLARRIHAVLHLRYVQGLTQSEAAAELNVGLRHLRREQDRAVRAVAALLFERPAHNEPGDADDTRVDADVKLPDPNETASLEALLYSSLHVFEPLLQQRHVQVDVALPSPLPKARAKPMVVRQLFIAALTWMAQCAPGSVCTVRGVVEGDWITTIFDGPIPSSPSAANEVSDTTIKGELQTIAQLAQMTQAEMALRATDNRTQTIEIRFHANARRTVLMIDDNLDAVRLAQRYLEQSDEFDLVPLSHPDEALHHAKDLRPASILLDVMMPEHDGWELLTLLKSDLETASIPIIVTSILADHGLARALGATSFLPRPYSALQLIASLRSAIARSVQPPAQQSA